MLRSCSNSFKKEYLFKYYVIVLLLLQIVPSNTQAKVTEINKYYVRLDVQNINNRFKKANLFMMPIKDDFRAKNFKKYRAIGMANKNSIVDVETSAINSAIRFILEKNGLKSLEAKKTNINSNTESEVIIISYEGVVKKPYEIIQKGYDRNNNYVVDLNIFFSPIAYREEWNELYKKHKVKSFFKQIKENIKELLE